MAPSARDLRRDQLLKLGLELFASRPYDAVVIDDLATAAGISKGLLYHYFGSKRAFYVACVRTAVGQLVQRLDLSDLTDASEAIVVGIARYLAFLDAHEGVYRALISGGLGAEPQVQELLEHARSAVTQLIAVRVATDPAHPLLRSTVRSWLGAVEAGGLDWLTHRTPEPESFARMQAAALAGRVLYLERSVAEIALLPGIREAATGHLLGEREA